MATGVVGLASPPVDRQEPVIMALSHFIVAFIAKRAAMLPKRRRSEIIVEASLFKKDVGDFVGAGELLGMYKREPVAVAFDAEIHSISFDPDEHLLRVVLIEVIGESERA